MAHAPNDDELRAFVESMLSNLDESAIIELEALRDPSVAEFLRRMERHRLDVIAALAEHTAA